MRTDKETEATGASAPEEQQNGAEIVRLRARVVELESELRLTKTICDDAQHRSANTLQLAAAALLMKAGQGGDGAREALTAAAERLAALAVIQRGLGLAGSGAEVVPGPLLHKLCQALVAQEEGRINAIVDCIGRPLPAPMTRAIGLIVNEAVTNAVKYAFPGGQPGQINVQLSELPQSRLLLVIEDDGIGMRHNGAGSGSRFMALLAAQLGGEIHRSTIDGRGVRLKAEFPERRV